jgi:hypothetical protein
MAADTNEKQRSHQTRPLSEKVASPSSKHEHRQREKDVHHHQRTSSGGESQKMRFVCKQNVILFRFSCSGHDARRTEHNSSTHKHPPQERHASGLFDLFYKRTFLFIL